MSCIVCGAAFTEESPGRLYGDEEYCDSCYDELGLAKRDEPGPPRRPKQRHQPKSDLTTIPPPLGTERGSEAACILLGVVFLLIGAYPHTAWLPDVIGRDKAGYVLTGVDVPPLDDHVCGPHETCVPGIFAVGDVRARSVKRVASAVGEGSIVIQQVGDHLGM